MQAVPRVACMQVHCPAGWHLQYASFQQLATPADAPSYYTPLLPCLLAAARGPLIRCVLCSLTSAVCTVFQPPLAPMSERRLVRTSPCLLASFYPVVFSSCLLVCASRRCALRLSCKQRAWGPAPLHRFSPLPPRLIALLRLLSRDTSIWSLFPGASSSADRPALLCSLPFLLAGSQPSTPAAFLFQNRPPLSHPLYRRHGPPPVGCLLVSSCRNGTPSSSKSQWLAPFLLRHTDNPH